MCINKQSKDHKFVAIGNNLGGVYLFDIKNNWKTYKINAVIRSVKFFKFIFLTSIMQLKKKLPKFIIR